MNSAMQARKFLFFGKNFSPMDAAGAFALALDASTFQVSGRKERLTTEGTAPTEKNLFGVLPP